jgi:hypothetical protein
MTASRPRNQPPLAFGELRLGRRVVPATSHANHLHAKAVFATSLRASPRRNLDLVVFGPSILARIR